MRQRLRKNANCDLRVRVTDDLRRRIEVAAAGEMRTISNFIIRVLESHFTAKPKKTEP